MRVLWSIGGVRRILPLVTPYGFLGAPPPPAVPPSAPSGWAAQSPSVRTIELVFLGVAVLGTSFAIANAWLNDPRHGHRR